MLEMLKSLILLGETTSVATMICSLRIAVPQRCRMSTELERDYIRSIPLNPNETLTIQSVLVIVGVSIFRIVLEMLEMLKTLVLLGGRTTGARLICSQTSYLFTAMSYVHRTRARLYSIYTFKL